MAKDHGSVVVNGVRRPAYISELDMLFVSPDPVQYWRQGTDAEHTTYVSGDNYPGTTKQRWWNASLDK